MQIKVADFGLARGEVADEMTCEAGTYRWMAPEVFSEDPIPFGVKKHYNHKVDVYSFAIVLWELVTNKVPFQGYESIVAAYAASKVSNLSKWKDHLIISISCMIEKSVIAESEALPGESSRGHCCSVGILLGRRPKSSARIL